MLLTRNRVVEQGAAAMSTAFLVGERHRPFLLDVVLRTALCATLVLGAGACRADWPQESRRRSSQAASSAGSGGGHDGGAGGSGAEGGGGAVDKAALCSETFGDALTDSYGRVDGSVLAVVTPSDTQCPLVNDDHLVIQVTMNGAVYRMVVNVDGIGFTDREAPLVGAAWSEGWHTSESLDYVDDLAVHSDDFDEYSLEALVPVVSSFITIGARISVYAVSSGGEYASSAHLIHRNDSEPDGAVVIEPETARSRFLLFRFGNQSF
jgi:hypothetical protein